MEGTAHLLDLIDSKSRCIIKLEDLNSTTIISGKLMILLRDGRTLIGFLRSCDQFANLVLHKAIGMLN